MQAIEEIVENNDSNRFIDAEHVIKFGWAGVLIKTIRKLFVAEDGNEDAE